jgi:dTDP-glucose 4,6-dehydratase
MPTTTWLVTGGAGFIGSSFVRLAVRRGATVVNLDKLTYAGNADNLADLARDPRHVFVHGDIVDAALVRGLLAQHRPAAIVNLAAESHVDRSIDAPGAFVRTNIEGTYVLLEAARHHVRSLPADEASRFRFLHVSTDEVYGSLGPEGRFTEDTAYAPSSPYAASKAAADHLVRSYFHTYGLATITTNCSNNFGPYQFPEKLIPLMILNALEGKPLPVYGDGRNVRDWIYVEDHCEAVALALERGRAGRTYNIGADNERANLDIVERLCAAIEDCAPAASNPALARAGVRAYRDLIRFVADRPGHDRRYAIDSARARAELGWSPRHSFDEALAKTVRWYLDHRGWCERISSGVYRRERLGLGSGGGGDDTQASAALERGGVEGPARGAR